MAAVIGSPVAHSLSPAIMNAAFAAVDLDWTFIAHEVAEGDTARALDWARSEGLVGLSVTMPHKAAVAAAVDDLGNVARRLDAVNCVVLDGDRLVGHNTDGGGFIDGLAHDSGFDPAGRRAVVHALAVAGASDVAVVNRTPARAEVAAGLADGVGRVADTDAVAGADLIVNATPVGMGEGDSAMPVDPDLLKPGQVAVDLIYHPLATPWVVALRERGIEAHGGLSMLIFQAALAFTHWTGGEAPVAAMEQAARAELAARAVA